MKLKNGRQTSLSDKTLDNMRFVPHDVGAKVRQVFHQLRSQAIGPLNGLLKNVFEWRGQVPVKGLSRRQLFLLGAVLLYQLVLLYQYERQLPLGRKIKPLLRAA